MYPVWVTVFIVFSLFFEAFSYLIVRNRVIFAWIAGSHKFSSIYYFYNRKCHAFSYFIVREHSSSLKTHTYESNILFTLAIIRFFVHPSSPKFISSFRAQEQDRSHNYFLHCNSFVTSQGNHHQVIVDRLSGVLRPWFFPIWISTLKFPVSLLTRFILYMFMGVKW